MSDILAGVGLVLSAGQIPAALIMHYRVHRGWANHRKWFKILWFWVLGSAVYCGLYFGIYGRSWQAAGVFSGATLLSGVIWVIVSQMLGNWLSPKILSWRSK